MWFSPFVFVLHSVNIAINSSCETCLSYAPHLPFITQTILFSSVSNMLRQIIKFSSLHYESFEYPTFFVDWIFYIKIYDSALEHRGLCKIAEADAEKVPNGPAGRERGEENGKKCRVAGGCLGGLLERNSSFNEEEVKALSNANSARWYFM